MKKILLNCTVLTVMALRSVQALAASGPAKILLTFDDGPDMTTSTLVINELNKRQIKAMFFVLTGPDKYLFKVYPKGETEDGFSVLKNEAQSGHLLACHWGGTYKSQLRLHTKRTKFPAYDSTGDGVIDKISEQGNALESDLIQCQERVNEALSQIEVADYETQKVGDIGYIRSPLWQYKRGDIDVRPIYEALGMKMVNTDTKIGDGGYRFAGYATPNKMAASILKGLNDGLQEIVVTMHDSNPITARDLPLYLDTLEKLLEENGKVKGRDWEYTQSITEIKTAVEGSLTRKAQ